MKNLLKFFLLCSGLISTLAAQAQGLPDELNPLMADVLLSSDSRLIEPTSPVLGKALAASIRYDQRHPEVILRELYSASPNLLRDLQLSAMAYFNTLKGPLKEYCSTEQKDVANDKSIAVVETAAIPLSVLSPLHSLYAFELASLRQNYVERSEGLIAESTRVLAQEYQAQRYDCNVVHKLKEMENKAKKILPKRWDRLVDLHSKVSSAEAAFPRIQFSINGFTQFVFDELLKLPYDKLSQLLKVTYEAQVEWLKQRQHGPHKERYFSSFIDAALKAGFLPRDILLVLTYSTRNMPSLDVQYGYDTRKALLLEAYFWKFHDHRDFVTAHYDADTFPNVIMKRNPGLYHYASAALLACEVKLQGYSGAMARIVALGNKVGYKVHKLLGEIARKDGKRPGLKEIKEIAKRQAFGPGVDAGKFGGKFGLRLCRKFTPKENRINEQEDLLDADDLHPEIEEAL